MLLPGCDVSGNVASNGGGALYIDSHMGNTVISSTTACKMSGTDLLYAAIRASGSGLDEL
eukprot:3931875-Rhodomonas_salina.1